MLALHADWKIAHAASSFIGFAAPLAPVVSRTAQERGIAHLEDIGLAPLAYLMPQQLSISLLWSPLQPPLCEITVGRNRRARLHVELPVYILREVPLEASSLVLRLLVYFFPAMFFPLLLGGGMA